MATTDIVPDATARVTLPPLPWRAVEHTLAPGFAQAEVRDATGAPIATVRPPTHTRYWHEVRDSQLAIAAALAGNANNVDEAIATLRQAREEIKGNTLGLAYSVGFAWGAIDKALTQLTGETFPEPKL